MRRNASTAWRIHRARVAQVALLLLTCCEHRVGIAIKGKAGTVQFSFKDCESGAPFPIHYIAVLDRGPVGPTDTAHSICEVRPPVGPARGMAEWTYNVRPPGYAMTCSALKPDATYMITIARPFATSSFRLRADGTVESLDAYCTDSPRPLP